ncbi:MAG: Ig-like domain-containing protein [Clostridia bacterium]|nr:Ig-like domain-containing protein [Clostridia bacterium]
MKKFNWRKYIYKIVVIVLIIFFVGGVGLGAANILSIEGTRELYTPEEPLTPFPETDAEKFDYINSAIKKALGADLLPKIECDESFSIDEDTFKNSANSSEITAAAVIAQSGMESAIEDRFEKKETDFGASAPDYLAPLNLNPADVVSTEINYIYYKCSMCTSSVPAEEYGEECPECGNLNTLDLRYSDDYEMVIHVTPGSASFASNPFPDTADIDGLIEAEGKKFYSLGSFSKQVTDAEIYVRINRLTDEIKELQFKTFAAVNAKLSFKDEYSGLGDVEISADTEDRCRYSFTWAGLSLDKHETTVELGSSEVLKATLTCDEPTDYETVWSSDNEDVLTVDNEGYLKTHKKYGDATITAKFVFKDVEFSDSCIVHVGVPAEGVDLNKGKLKMKTGEEFNLVAEFDPGDTTNTKCFWFTNDAEVAAIDENGKVTAAGAGKTVVYVVTDDGNYYSSCEVEVTD